MTIIISGSAPIVVIKIAYHRQTFMNRTKLTGIQNTYDDAPGHIFYTCPKCGNEYLATFITKEHGEVMCIDCWNERYGNR